MGLLDKVKAQATAATEMAKDAAAKGQAKMYDSSAKKSADGMLRDLGAAVYASETGRSTPTTSEDVDRLMAALKAHEAEHGPITLAPESAAAAPTAAPAPPPQAAAPGSPPPPPPAPAATVDTSSPPPAPAAPASPPPAPAATVDPLSPPPAPPTAQPL
jgi:hypothetical protein